MSQSDTLFLLIEKPYIQGKIDTNYKFGFIINSDDKRFVCDYYEFLIHSYQGWDEEGNDVYVSLKDLRKKVKIDTLKCETISSLSKEKKWWEIHNYLSLKKKIFLLEKRETVFNSKTNKFDFGYFIMPMVYEGTRKNIVPTDLSIKTEN